MERNYQKEFALALKELSKVTEEKFAYQSLYDDALKRLEKHESSSVKDIEDAEFKEIKGGK